MGQGIDARGQVVRLRPITERNKMYCRYCGKEIADQAVICIHCGCNPRAGNKNCWNCGAETANNAGICLKCGVALTPAVDPNAKSRLVAGLFGLLLGGFGVHRFYLGYIGIGVVQIIVTLFTCGVGGLWGLIEGIVILAGGWETDADGRPLKEQ